MSFLAQPTLKSDSSFATEKVKKGPGESSEIWPGLIPRKKAFGSLAIDWFRKNLVQMFVRSF